MAYQSLYRRYRSRRFGELRGQDHVVKALRNAVRDDRVGHAYLFSGPRGTGKTSTARILAKVLNCERPVDGEPCGECPSCLAVEAGNSYDVHELDAASNNGVDAMRDLIDKASLGTPGRTKVYILDEVHMLSRAAEAALLKTLEEPPAHVVFVLATTDPQKVSPTIKSRTQHLDFRLLPADVLTGLVRDVIADAGLDVSDEAVDAVVRQGAGSARDTLSALDQVVAAGGVVDVEEPLDEIVEALADRDTARALTALAAATAAGRDPRTLADHLVAQLRDGFLSLMAPQLVRLPDAAAARVAAQAQRLGAAALVRAMEVIGTMLVEFRHAPDPRLLLDVALVQLTNPDADTSSAALLERIERLEKVVADGVPAVREGSAPPSGSTPAPGPAGSGPSAARAVLGAAKARAAPSHDTPAPATDPGATPPSTASPDPAAGVKPKPRSGRGGTSSGGTGGGPGVGATTTVDGPADLTTGGLSDGEDTTDMGGTASAARAVGAGQAPAALATGTAVASGTAVATSAADLPGTGVASDTSGGARSPAGTATVAGAGGGVELPGVDELARAWSAEVSPTLKPFVRALYSAGWFVTTSGGGTAFALPNASHRDRCESYRADVEAALASRFGRPIPLQLVVRSGEAADAGWSSGVSESAPPPGASAPSGRTRATDPDEHINLDDLVDAPPEHADPVARLRAAFPGAELVVDPDTEPGSGASKKSPR